MPRSTAIPALLVALLAAACGSSRVDAPACQVACVVRACGDDGCGGSCGSCEPGASCTAQGACQPVVSCTPACAARACGDDGCGGSCGGCAPGSTCTAQGACQAASLNCPGPLQCYVLEYTAWNYDCVVPVGLGPICQVRDQIGVYTSFEDCRTAGCEGGNSTCGDQHGGTDPALAAACHACISSCTPSAGTLCPEEVAGGCNYGGSLAGCSCR